jgi:hypothetical protein
MKNQTYKIDSASGRIGKEDSPLLCSKIIEQIPIDQLLSFKSVLDVGSGYGGISKAYVKRVESYIGRQEALSRIWLIDNHIGCVNRCLRLGFKNVVHADFLSWTPNMKFDVVIGNPPYGNGASLAPQFINKASEISDLVVYVLPKSMKKASRLNRVTTDLQLMSSEDLPDGTFPRGIGAVIQTWQNTGVQREKIAMLADHPDFDFTSREDSNHCICRCGSAAGLSFTSYANRSINTHFMIKVKHSSVIDNLLKIQDELVEAGHSASNGIPSLAKHDLISIYSKHYG